MKSRAEVLRAPWKSVIERQPVLEVARIDERSPAADVKEDREPRFLGLCHTGKRPVWLGECVFGQGRRHEQRFRPGGKSRSPAHRPGPIEIGGGT